MKIFKLRRGFTLIELLIVIGIIAVLAAVVFIVLDPVARLRDSRNTTRSTDVKSIADAVRLYQIDAGGKDPAGVDTNWRMLGTATNGCNVNCSGGTSSSSNIFSYSTRSDFDKGSYSNTIYTDGGVTLLSGSNYAVYTSPVFDAQKDINWASLSWIASAPFGKELLNNKQIEAGYPNYNTNMTDNYALYHFNEASTAMKSDSSGNGYDGQCYQSCGVNLKTFNYAPYFAGENPAYYANGNFRKNHIVLHRNSPAVNLGMDSSFPRKNFTVAAWVYPVLYAVTSSPELLYPPNGVGVVIGQKNSWALALQRTGSVSAIAAPCLGEGYRFAGSGVTRDKWSHVAFTYDGTNILVYINGVLVDTRSCGNIDDFPANPDDEMRIGTMAGANTDFTGWMDEVAIFRKTMSADEIKSLYARGAGLVYFQVRACTTANCADNSTYVGPNGTASTYFTELLNSTTGLPSFSLSSSTGKRYFQYRASLYDYSGGTLAPKLTNITVGGANPGEENTGVQSACLDLSSTLGNKLPKIPVDPSVGSLEKTYYAIKKDEKGKIVVKACGAEGEEISTNR